VRTIANLSPVFCRQSDKISHAAETLIKTGHRRIPICTGQTLVGVITITDLIDACLRQTDFNGKIETIMVRDVIACSENDTIGFILQKFKLSRKGGFPLVNSSNKLTGIISERDIVKRFSNVMFDVNVKDAMVKKPFVISPKTSVADCARAMVSTHYRRLPVVGDGKLMGLVTTIDILKYMGHQNFEFNKLNLPVSEIMITDLITVREDADLSKAVDLMTTNNIGGLLIRYESRLEGILTERNILEEIH
jgi:CBS domain-containing protein